MAKKPPCPICFNDEDDSFITLPCNCKACGDCLSQWITLKISENHYTIDSKTTCIMASCKKDLCLQDIYEKMPLSSQQKMDEVLLQVYFTKEKDVRKCPNSNCNYAGIIDTKSSCIAPLQCDLCGTQWRDKQHYTTFENLQDWYKNRSKVQAEDLSETWIKKVAKKCPSCKVNIEKNGGCEHMTCKKCGHQFCWVCRWTSPRHNAITHLYRQCLPLFIALLIIIPLITYAIYYFGMWGIVKFFVGNFFWIIYKVICFFFQVGYLGFYYGFYSIYYILWNFGLSILNFIISNAFVIMILRVVIGKRLTLETRAKTLLGVSAFVGVSVYINYFNTILHILKIEFFILLIIIACILAVIGCSKVHRGRRKGYLYNHIGS